LPSSPLAVEGKVGLDDDVTTKAIPPSLEDKTADGIGSTRSSFGGNERNQNYCHSEVFEVAESLYVGDIGFDLPSPIESYFIRR
jgi:hypothetical protein